MPRIDYSTKFWASVAAASYDQKALRRRVRDFIEWKRDGTIPDIPFDPKKDKPSSHNRKGKRVGPYADKDLHHCHLELDRGDPILVYRPHPAQGRLLLVCVTTHAAMFEDKQGFNNDYGDVLDEGMDLLESRQGRLFHWTVPRNFAEMAAQDTMTAREFVEYGRVLRPKGISFTRDPHATLMNDRSLVMVFDAGRISHNYRLQPRYGDSREAAAMAAASDGEFVMTEPRREAEEMIDRDLKPLSRYLTHLVMTEHHFDWMLDAYAKALLSKQRGRAVSDHLVAQWAIVFEYCRRNRIAVVPVPDLGSNAFVRLLDANAVDLSTWDARRLMDEIEARRA